MVTALFAVEFWATNASVFRLPAPIKDLITVVWSSTRSLVLPEKTYVLSVQLLGPVTGADSRYRHVDARFTPHAKVPLECT
jgi:hypothetical protein